MIRQGGSVNSGRRLYLGLFAAAFGVAAISGAAGARAANWEDLLQKLYPAAKAEGTVVVNSERVEEVGGQDGIAAFEKRFPGVKVTFNGTAGSQLPSEIISESTAGKVSIDAFRSDPDRASPMAKRGLLMSLDMKDLTDQQTVTYFDSSFVKLSDFVTNFFYNTDAVKAEDRPKTYEDLLDPKWKGKMTLDARGGQIAHLLAYKIWDADKFWKYVADLKNQDPIWTSRDTEAMQKVASGEAEIGTGSLAAVEELKRKGAPVDFLFLPPSLSQVRGMGIVKGAPHPNAAKLFVGWLLSPEGLKARDNHDVGVAAPGTKFYDLVTAAHAQITYENNIEGILARDAVGEQITKTWGVLK